MIFRILARLEVWFQRVFSKVIRHLQRIGKNAKEWETPHSQGPTAACHLEPGRLGKADYPLLNLDPEVGRKIITRGDLERVGRTAGKETIWARALGSTPQTPARASLRPLCRGSD